MKKVINICLFFVILSLAFSCKTQDKKEADPSTVEATEEKTSEESDTLSEGVVTKDGKAVDPVKKVVDNFSQAGINLTEEQLKMLEKLSNDFDLSGESTYERRLKLKEFKNEVFGNILTEEQRNKFNAERKKRRS